MPPAPAKEGEPASTEQRTRIFLKIHPALAPVKAAVFPLVKKDGLPEKAKEIVEQLKYDFNIVYEERDTVGKRYTRQLIMIA